MNENGIVFDISEKWTISIIKMLDINEGWRHVIKQL